MEKKIGADNIYRQLFNAPSRDNLIIYASCSFLGSCCFLERLSAFHAERNELFSLEYCSFSFFFFLFPFYIIFSVHRFADSDKFYITPVLERNDVLRFERRDSTGKRAEVCFGIYPSFYYLSTRIRTNK